MNWKQIKECPYDKTVLMTNEDIGCFFIAEKVLIKDGIFSSRVVTAYKEPGRSGYRKYGKGNIMPTHYCELEGQKMTKEKILRSE